MAERRPAVSLAGAVCRRGTPRAAPVGLLGEALSHSTLGGHRKRIRAKGLTRLPSAS
jgi:hypothetical protein